MERDIYDTDKRVKSKIRALKRSDLSKESIERILEFVDKYKTDGLSAHRQSFYLTQLRGLAEIMDRAFLKPCKRDIERAIAEIEKRGYKEWTKTNYKTALKRFYKWHLTGDKRYPPQVEWIKTRKGNNNKLPEDLPTQEEVNAIIEACKNPRDRALISSSADSGCRIGELLTMRIGDVVFDDYGVVFRVTGKTGDRRVRVVGDSIAHLAAWLEVHPQRTESKGPLWVGLTPKTRGRRMNYPQGRKVLTSAVERAGIKKQMHFHSFRHLRATQLAAHIAEAPLEAQMGWVHGSEMTKIYVHLSGRDVDRAVLKAEGIEMPEETVNKRELPKPCSRCDTVNPSISKFCRRCRLPLTAEGLAEAEALSDGPIHDDRLAQLEARFDTLLDHLAHKMPTIASDPTIVQELRQAPWIDNGMEGADEEETAFLKDKLEKFERERREYLDKVRKDYWQERTERTTDDGGE